MVLHFQKAEVEVTQLPGQDVPDGERSGKSRMTDDRNTTNYPKR